MEDTSQEQTPVKDKKKKVEVTHVKVEHTVEYKSGGITVDVPCTSVNPVQIYAVAEFPAIEKDLLDNFGIKSKIIEQL